MYILLFVISSIVFFITNNPMENIMANGTFNQDNIQFGHVHVAKISHKIDIHVDIPQELPYKNTIQVKNMSYFGG